MKYTPRPYQKIAGDFIAEHKRCALFMDMGLGKTAVSLTYLKEQILDEFSINKALIIGPLRVAQSVWSAEASKWDHLHGLVVSRVLGTLRQRVEALEAPADVYVINRENVVWLVEYLGNNWDFDAIIIDELSSFKSSASKRWKALRKVIRKARIVVGLTGTPAGGGYIDLWPQIYLIDGGQRLGKTLTEFRRRFFRPGRGKGHVVYEWIINPGAKEEIDNLLSDICLSMSKEDWLQMPELIFNDVIVKMDGKARKLYDEFEKEKVLPLLEGMVIEDVEAADNFVAGTTAATVNNKLLQMANGAVYDDEGGVFHIHDAKLDALEEIAEGNPGQPLLVFYAFKHDMERIKTRFPDAVALNEGDTQAVISRWNAGKIPMLLCHPASAGHGLNLQEGGHIAVWFGLTWNLELYQQANARLYRQGQVHSVIIHHIICENTQDERVIQALEQKDVTQRSLLEALKNYLKKAS